MTFIYSFIIGGLICAIGTAICECKVPGPAILAGCVIAGGILSPVGIISKLSAMGAGGICTTAVGFGNAAYDAGKAVAQGNFIPLVLVSGLIIVLVLTGAICGGRLKK